MRNALRAGAAAALALLLGCLSVFDAPLRVGYVIWDGRISSEDRSALEWLESEGHLEPKTVSMEDPAAAWKTFDVLWIHIADSSRRPVPEDATVLRLREALLGGGKYVFTGYASLLPHLTGMESARPDIHVERLKENDIFDQKGLQGWRGHPVFDGLSGGAYLHDGIEDRDFPTIGYFGERFPEDGRVIAVEKSHLTIHPDRRLMVEYRLGRGRALSIGFPVSFASANRSRPRMERFVSNALAYACGRLQVAKPTHWEKHAPEPAEFSIRTRPLNRSQHRTLSDAAPSELMIPVERPGADFVDLAGRRVLMMGREGGGLDEVWVHPFRVLKEFRAGIVTGDTVLWLDTFPKRLEIRPESLTRTYRIPLGEIAEIVFPSMEAPGGIVHYRADVRDSVRLILGGACDQRWMWPYDSDAAGPLRYAYDDRLGALHVRDRSEDFRCLFGGDVIPDRHMEGPFSSIVWENGRFGAGPAEEHTIRFAASYTLDRDVDFCLNFGIAGTDQGAEEALLAYRFLLENPRHVLAEGIDHYRTLLAASTVIESPQERFNDLWKWSLVGTDRFFVHTPSLGRAFVAGYGTSDMGWDGGQAVSGRPGYAWYFGRDAAWTCFGVADYGDFDRVRDQLAFFRTHQDVSGKIFHELTSSGAVHFDAADATPLYVLLAARYLRASGDVRFIRSCWPSLHRAMDFLYSTDTDGDGLIENANVGHGWIEGGPLSGINTTFYLAGLWARALEDAAYVAGILGEGEYEAGYDADALRVRRILNEEFWDARTRTFHYGKKADGRFISEPTVLPAVPAYLGMLDEGKAMRVLKHLSENDFSTDWGVRILSSESPRFDAGSYHGGSVWPLFTGWSALAEYRYGRSSQAFTHLFNSLRIKEDGAKGFVEEVLHGNVYRPHGVCPHQAWSETAVLHPGITGMIGWQPDAPARRARLSPRFPAHWKRVGVRHLRMGDSRIDFLVVRSKNETHYEIALEEGRPFTLELCPEIPDGMIVDRVLVDGMPVGSAGEAEAETAKIPLEIQLKKSVHVALYHHGGLALVPVLPEPEPGGRSQGYRVITMGHAEGVYTIELEGRSGTYGEFQARVFDQQVREMSGGRLNPTNGTGLVSFRVWFPRANSAYVKKQVRIRLE